MGLLNSLTLFLRAIARERKPPPRKLIKYRHTTNSNEQLDQDIEKWKKECCYLSWGLNLPIGFEYSDGSRNITRRRVDVKQFIRHMDSMRYIEGLCYLRNETRTFKESRMSEIIELESGNIYNKPSEFFDKYCLFDTPEKQTLQAILHILIFLARIDNKYTVPEKHIIQKTINKYVTSPHDEEIYNYALRKKADKDEFLDAVDRLEKMDEETISFIIKTAKEIIESDNRITVKEREMFSVLAPDNTLEDPVKATKERRAKKGTK
jgi:hypothetical protein